MQIFCKTSLKTSGGYSSPTISKWTKEKPVSKLAEGTQDQQSQSELKRNQSQD